MRNFLFVFPVLVVTLLVSCQSVTESSKVGAQFYASIKNKNYEDIIKHLDESALSTHTAEEWKNVLKDIQSYSGDLKAFKRQGISTNYNNGISTTKLTFKVQYEQGTRDEVLSFIERDGDYRILSYNSQPNDDHKEVRAEGEELQTLVNDKLDVLYSQIGAREFEALVEELDREALQTSTKDDWIGVLTQRDELAGDFIDYELISIDESMNAHFQQVVVVLKANYQKGHLFERLVLLNRVDGLKVRGYQYNSDLDKLTNQ